jgi:hypothetical protein
MQHPFLDSYNQIRLNCGSPYHYCDAMEFFKLKEFNCPTCGTPFTTAEVWKRSLKHLQSTMRSAMSICLEVFSLQKKLVQEGKALRENFSGKVLVNSTINRVNEYLDSFPFRGVPGLEFLARESYNIQNRAKYGYTLPTHGTVRVLEEYIAENNLNKEEIRIIDYGTGTALWSRFFLENGFEVLSVDCKKTRELYVPSEECFLSDIGREIHYVNENECGLPPDCSKEVLFLCWPENPSETDYPMYAGRVLEEFRERNGALAIYVGWGRGKNTASSAFFDEMEHNWDFNIVNKDKEATWSSDMYLLKKKCSSESL